ncbi:integrator complex subunit 7-like isoform X2 [Mizuhopecten yessoensis]|uniref:Integrator complex subunit 7 n=1 Tax=Mizuhopecten yessoensis TaxID=6573 RepID=A0A210R012_MIZYE|nr:integrator complex subunit 7-like isoform X2 [Mizuhopecten yessoensis]OWF54349.1 Integrator complex subunit 7 [Mizuhopecten yessoensis]
MAASVSFPLQTSATGIMQENASVEQEQDANLALTDLDKGLRSAKPGVQCESVIRFPRLFEKYPFPILINSAFLRLSDVFRAGNNFLRWCILRVTLQSEKHLDKILNVDEFVRRIFSVIHSNDPVARALTVRTLGSMASVIPERKTVHHTIVTGLDSNDRLEVDAAVFAAKRFAAQSHTFAANICSKIATMIEQIATPVDLKLRLIPILQHMHHDVDTAAKARGVCQDLLAKFPAQKFMTLTLHTMTQLAAQSLVDIQSHVQLLMSCLRRDPRTVVKFVILRDMNSLARKTPHLWTHTSVEALCEFVLSAESLALKTAGVEVLSTLSGSVAFQLYMQKDVSENQMKTILEVCNLCYLCDNASLSASATHFFTNVAICHKKSNCPVWNPDENIVSGARLSLTTQICLSAWSADSQDQAALKVCLHCAVRLAEVYPETGPFFATEIVQLLEMANDKNCLMLCECLAAIGEQNSDVILDIVPQLLYIFQNLSQQPKVSGQLKTYIGTLLFQAADGKPVPMNVRELVIGCMESSTSPWFAYKLGRQAMRYGQYHVATDLFSMLSRRVASEHFHFWMLGLHEICDAEAHLCDTGTGSDVIRIDDTMMHYQKGLAALKAAATPNSPLQFQCWYVRLRTELLQAHCQLVRNCNTFRTCPPPAISTALAMSRGREISRCGQILSQLNKSMGDYENLSTKFSALYQSSFDADPHTLRNIILLQQCCEVMKSAILTVVKPDSPGCHQQIWMPTTSSHKDQLSKAVQQVQLNIDSFLQADHGPALTHKHIDLLLQAVKGFIQATFRFPRFFFQRLQCTTLKLAVSPQQNAQMEPILIHHDTFLTLKVEGIVQHGQRRELYRSVGQVRLTVTTTLVNRNQISTDSKMNDSLTTNTLSQSVSPHNDYFSVSFLLAFPISGVHSVSIEAAVEDRDGALWCTGPKVCITVKSYDDAMMKKPKSASVRTSFGQMPGHS